MRLSRVSWVLLVGIAWVYPALANPPPAESQFTRRLPNSEERVRVTEGTFDDEVCLQVQGFASDGEHITEITVYDASGREVSRVTGPVQAKGATWRRSFCPATIKDEHAPGEWWFVVTLDDQPVISASIKLAFGKPKSSETVKSTPKPKPTPAPHPGAADR